MKILPIKCYFGDCILAPWIARLNRFNQWFLLCEKHYLQVEMVAEPTNKKREKE